MTWPCRRSAGFCLALIAVLATPATAQDNMIESLSVAEEAPGRITVDVVYRYSGDHGDDVFVSVVMAMNGKTLPYYGYRPGAVRTGHNRTRVELGTSQSAPDLLFSSELVVSMYVGGGETFLTRRFAFAKTWRRPGVPLPPQPTLATLPADMILLPDHQEIEVLSTGTTAEPAEPQRQVLPNGHVVLTYPDGTIRERYSGGETVTRPDGTVQTYLFQNAQPPTPPTAPDAANAIWLDNQSQRLLDIIGMLVGHDQASIDNYLAQEGPSLSVYQRIEARSGAIGWLVAP